MGASYLEKLIWNFFADRFFRGFKVYFRLENLPLTVLVILGLSLYFLGYIDMIALMVISLAYILLGLAFRKEAQTPIGSLIMCIVGIVLILVLDIYSLISLDTFSRIFFYIALSMLFVWFLLNTVILIYQSAEFFASTAGLLLMYGSDENRIFLSPLPQLILVGTLAVSAYALVKFVDVIFLIYALSAIVSLVMMYTLRGKPIRSAFSIFSFFLVYSLVSNYYNYGKSLNTIYWAVLTIFSILYITQMHARRIVGEKKETLFLMTALYGYMMALILVVSNIMLNPSLIRAWILLSALSYLISAPLVVLYLKARGRLAYYQERSKMDLKQLLLEATVILGRKAIGSIADIAIRGISRLFKRED